MKAKWIWKQMSKKEITDIPKELLCMSCLRLIKEEDRDRIICCNIPLLVKITNIMMTQLEKKPKWLIKTEKWLINL